MHLRVWRRGSARALACAAWRPRRAALCGRWRFTVEWPAARPAVFGEGAENHTRGACAPQSPLQSNCNVTDDDEDDEEDEEWLRAGMRLIVRRAETLDGHVRVDLRRREAGVAEERLDAAEI